MRFLDSLRFVTSKPDWFTNLLMCALCMLIPAIGPIVLMGYCFEVFDALRRDPAQKDYPSFTFDRFVPYLTRGIWLFLVQIIMQAILGVPIFVMYMFAFLVSIAGAKANAGPLVALVWVLYVVVVVIVSVGSAVLQWPMKIHAGIRQTFEPKGMIAFTKDFIRTMWKEIVVSMLFLMAWGLLLAPVGVLTCCLGFFIIGPYLMLAQHHLEQQAYQLYLTRGGSPIPEKPISPAGEAGAADADRLASPPPSAPPPGSPPAPPDAFREKP